jgi:hypothetical protein
MTVLQRWIIAVRGRSGCGILLGGSGLSVSAVTGVATAAHHHRRSPIPVSCEPETTMQAAQLLHNCGCPRSLAFGDRGWQHPILPPEHSPNVGISDVFLVRYDIPVG